ncbi:MAG: trehalose-phosphatase [Asticcacaulis sp.]
MKPEPQRLDLTDIALFLDLDGTLAPIMSRPDAVVPDIRRTKLLKDLQKRLKGRLAVVSGREVSMVDCILEQAVMSVAGVHGLQRRTASGERMDAVAPDVLMDVADVFLAMAEAHTGIVVEDKGLSVAVHYRHAPDLKADILSKARELAEANGLKLQGGHEVIELRTPGNDKGDAIRAFLNEAPFAGYRPVFVGDDLTDEAGFVLVEQCGGFGVKVGGGESAASYTLNDSDAVINWLEESLLCLT